MKNDYKPGNDSIFWEVGIVFLLWGVVAGLIWAYVLPGF